MLQKNFKIYFSSEFKQMYLSFKKELWYVWISYSVIKYLVKKKWSKYEWMTPQNTRIERKLKITALAWKSMKKVAVWSTDTCESFCSLGHFYIVQLFWDGIYNHMLISQCDYVWDWWKHRWLVSTYVWKIHSVRLVCLWGSATCAHLEGTLMCLRGSDPVIFR